MTRLVVAAAFMAAFLCVPPAIALPLCVPSAQLLSSLTALGEVPVWRGLAGVENSQKFLVVLLVHPTTQNWTLISTTPTRMSCVIAIGGDAEMIGTQQLPGL